MYTRLLPLVFLTGLAMVGCDEAAPTAADSSCDLEVSEHPAIVLSFHGNNGAVRWIPDDECAVIDGYGDLHFTSCRNQIATHSSNGNAAVTVKASGVPTPGGVVKWGPEDPGATMAWILGEYFGVHSPPYPCIVLGTDGGFLFTLKWSGVVSPSGQATFSCHYAKKWEYQWPS